MQFFLSIYRFIFCRAFFYRLNEHVFKLSLRGIGILNSEGPDVTGEQFFLHRLAASKQVKLLIDAGANTDLYGVVEFPAAQIFGFEPHPQTFQKLKNKIYGKNVKLFNLGLSDKKRSAKLWDFAQDADLKLIQPTSTLASLDKTVIQDLHKQKAQFFTVELTTLDLFSEKHKIKKIDLLKIDTEGHEYHVMAGAKKLLKKGQVRIVQFEFNEMNVMSRTFLSDFYQLLPNHDFYRLNPYGLYPLGEYRPLTHEIFGFQNIVALPKAEAKLWKSIFNL